MIKYFSLMVMLVFLIGSIQAQQTRTPCKITVASGEVYEGYIKNYDVKTTDFNGSFKLLGKKGNKGREFNPYHIMLVEIKNKIYKPKVNSKNERRIMLFLGKNDDFSAYINLKGADSYTPVPDHFGGFIFYGGGGSNIQSADITYYFYKDEEVYKVPSRLTSDIFYHTMGPLISKIQEMARKRKREIPDYLANY